MAISILTTVELLNVLASIASSSAEDSVEIIGVKHDMRGFKVDIDEDSRSKLIEETTKILRAGKLEPGHAGERNGKLQLEKGQMVGRVRRSLLMALSNRQHLK